MHKSFVPDVSDARKQARQTGREEKNSDCGLSCLVWLAGFGPKSSGQRWVWTQVFWSNSKMGLDPGLLVKDGFGPSLLVKDGFGPRSSGQRWVWRA